jgi:hypothetical protein
MTIQAWPHNPRPSRHLGSRRARGLLLALLFALAILPSAAGALPPVDDPGDLPDDPRVPDLTCLDDTDCDDGNVCNGRERCIIGGGGRLSACRSSLAILCNDLDPCTADSCSPTSGCEHEPILTPECQVITTFPDTTSTTSTTSTSTSSSTRPSSSTTSTTLPGTGSCTPGTAECDDGDPCTRDECSADGTCVAVPLTGIAAVTCVCERIVPQDCGGVLPARIEKVVARACLGASLAATEDGARQRRLLKASKRAFGVAARRTAQLTRKALLTDACGSVLGGQLLDAKFRAETAAAGQ